MDASAEPQTPEEAAALRELVVKHRRRHRWIALVFSVCVKEDFGILYLEANLLARRHRLIWVAGLGSVGTVGTALALQDPRVMEALAPGLTDEQAYGCALVRYRFADEQRPLDGALACVAMTREVLRSPSEDPTATAPRP
jgi:hypothetical protein